MICFWISDRKLWSFSGVSSSSGLCTACHWRWRWDRARLVPKPNPEIPRYVVQIQNEILLHFLPINFQVSESEILLHFLLISEGTSVEATVKGMRHVKLLKFSENYEIDCPNLLIRLLPAPSAEWSGTVRIVCKESELEAELIYYRSNAFLGLGGDPRCVKGKIFSSRSGEIICEIDGHWDRIVSAKDAKTGKVSVLYDAESAIADLKTPVVRNQEVTSFWQFVLTRNLNFVHFFMLQVQMAVSQR